MSGAKHTPGPWTVYDDSNDGKTNRIEIAALGKTVARIYHSVPAEDLPNALLIGAAPELLEVLEHASHINSFREFNDYLPTIRAVISKATGSASHE